MSININENNSGRGGNRKGAGRKKNSGENIKISVSVQVRSWNTALQHWRRNNNQRKASWLVDKLLTHYVETGGSILETEAVV
jgi:hypothetical protein